MRSSSSSLQPHVVPGEIAKGYEAWSHERHRAAGAGINFGDWWRMEQSYWRMAWIEATEELYAEELGRSDRFVLLGRLDRKEVLALLRNWYDGDNLQVLLQRLEASRARKRKADNDTA